ncbi:restriction endonuclease subunit S [Bacillus anthracis]|uniref:restriction endonuclease subunit S n=1 Tax=Bacillus anthracis TaxID=1392 RepID=UPI001D0DCBF4|nr:restriction endonuclease subunit S [Bacillus anthracis]MCC2347490.1 restriction endonuclease subunit S [Bacillus anthracis]
MDEKIPLSRVHNYLTKLGFSHNQIINEVRLENGRIVDFVVYQDNSPLACVEVKLDFYTGFSNIKELKFNPYVRQLQNNAKTINAPYYLLTDGANFLWFKTDSTGRPMFIKEPVRKSSAVKLNSTDSLSNALLKFHHLTSELSDSDKLILILAKLLSDRNIPYVENELLHFLPQIKDSNLILNEFPNIILPESEIIGEAFKLLKSTDFYSVEPIKLINIIEETFQFGNSTLPNWLIDFMLHLFNIDRNSNIWDISNMNNNLMSAMIRNNIQPSSLLEVRTDTENYLLSKLKQLILNYDIKSSFFDSVYSLDELDYLEKPTNILAIPNYLKKTNINNKALSISSKDKNKQDEFTYTSLSNIRKQGRIVLFIPDRILFSNSKKGLRKKLLSEFRINSIFSFGPSTIHANINENTSILVFDNKVSNEPYNVFMAYFHQSPEKDTLNSLEIKQFSTVIKEYNEWAERGYKPSKSKLSWLIQSNELDINNLSATRYIYSKDEDINLRDFSQVPLKDIVNVLKKGQRIRLDNKGDISIVGPACIRPMEINYRDMNKSSIKNISNTLLTVHSNDILINSISTYLGAAALVPSELEGTYYSDHITLIRPNHSVVLPEYLVLALNSNYVSKQILLMSNGSVLPSISIQSLKEIRIPMPNITTQKMIIKEHNALKNRINTLKKELNHLENDYQQMLENFFKKEDLDSESFVPYSS